MRGAKDDQYIDRTYYNRAERIPRSKWKSENPNLVRNTITQERWDTAFQTPMARPLNPCSDCEGKGLKVEVKDRHTGSLRYRVCESCGGTRSARADGAKGPSDNPAQAG